MANVLEKEFVKDILDNKGKIDFFHILIELLKYDKITNAKKVTVSVLYSQSE